MKTSLLVVILLNLTLGLNAHPGSGIAVDNHGRVFFTAGPMVVMIETNGTARTIVHDKTHEKFYQLHHIQRAPDGGLLTASDRGNAIWRFTPEGELTRFYPPASGTKAPEVGVGGDPFAVDRQGNIYAVRSEQFRSTEILKITPDGQSTVLAGSDWGFADGKGAAAKFGNLHGGSMVVGEDGTLLLTDNGSRVRRISKDGAVSTLARATNQIRFEPAGLAIEPGGNLLVVDSVGFVHRFLTNGVVVKWAGSGKGRSQDGPRFEAVFDAPTGIAIGPNGDVFVLEPNEPRVRKISEGRVETIHRGLP
jgi:streptogramin lyase